jgi:hypothetical protein
MNIEDLRKLYLEDLGENLDKNQEDLFNFLSSVGKKAYFYLMKKNMEFKKRTK